MSVKIIIVFVCKYAIVVIFEAVFLIEISLWCYEAKNTVYISTDQFSVEQAHEKKLWILLGLMLLMLKRINIITYQMCVKVYKYLEI